MRKMDLEELLKSQFLGIQENRDLEDLQNEFFDSMEDAFESQSFDPAVEEQMRYFVELAEEWEPQTLDEWEQFLVEASDSVNTDLIDFQAKIRNRLEHNCPFIGKRLA